MMEAAHEEPMELISCGKCSAVNRVPYGLEQFRCHTCRTLVNIAREPSAACAAASPSAQFYEGLANPTGAGSAAAGAAGAENRKASSSSKGGGFFGSLTKKMEKVVRSIESGLDSGGKPAPAPATFEPPQRHAPALSAEEEQLQWALNASIEEEKRQHTTPTPGEVDVPVNPAPSADFNSSAGDQLQVVAAQAAQRLRAAEERAKRAEDALAAVQARERAATEERAQLKRQLEDNEGLIKGLTEQLDALNSKFSKQAQRCKSLEQALATAQRAAVAARDAAAEGGADGQGAEAEEAEMEHHGTIAQLLTRITELESTLMSATHFAPPIVEGEAEAEAVAAEAEGDVVKPAAPEAAQPAATPAEVGSPTGPDAAKSAAVLEADEAVAAPEAAQATEVVAAEKEEEPALPVDKADAAGAAATEPQAAGEVAADPPKAATAEGSSAGEDVATSQSGAQEAASEAKTAEVDPAAPECAEGASKPPAALSEAAAVVSAAAPATTSANEAPIGSAGEAS
mmetsp:Transcript_50973/g.147966  ORF Transcript_50973/g.147966 Transcript_50973/m.147966 type:complete len:513 (-) Transcript_50973:127-1665(-)